MKPSQSLAVYAARGDVKKAKQLLSIGVNPNEKDEGQRSALHWAAQEGHVEMIRCLVAAGAEVNVSDDGGFTPLSTAAGEGDSSIVKVLLKAGASARIRNPSDLNGTPLHVASSWGYFDVVKSLVEHSDVEINARDADGKTALGYASDGGFTTVIEYLVKHGATL